VNVRRLLRKLNEAVAKLTGAGALANARQEVNGAQSALADLDAQLERIKDPNPRRAA
jgi:hypothetical protein